MDQCAAVNVPPASPRWLDRHQPGSILVFRALQVGDMLCAVPALRALRRRLPDAPITLAGLPWARQLVERLPELLDDFIAFPGYPGLPEQVAAPDAYAAFVQQVQQRNFDLVVQLHGDGSIVNPMIRSFGTPWQAGFHDSDGWADPAFLRYPRHGHEIHRLLALTTHLGAPSQDDRLAFPLQDGDARELAQAALTLPMEGAPYVCLHAGARDAARRWPASQFAALGDALAAQGLQVVLTGSEHERLLTAAIASAMKAPAFDAAAPISLGAMACLMAGARLLVTNDTGTSHLACALRLPSVVIFRASEMARWAPLDRARHRAVWDPRGSDLHAVRTAALALLASASR